MPHDQYRASISPLVYTECLLQLEGNKTCKPVGLLLDYIPQPHAKAPFIVNRACLFQHPYLAAKLRDLVFYSLDSIMLEYCPSGQCCVV